MTKNKDLLTSSYDFELPSELIAQRPMEPRDHSRLLVYDENQNSVTHTFFYNIDQFLPKDSSLIFNKTKVRTCRLLGYKSTGGKAEIFILEELGEYQAKCFIKTSGKKKVGDYFFIQDDIQANIEGQKEGVFFLKFNQKISQVIRDVGMMPIPPYIRNGLADKKDEIDYQTIYAQDEGSVATPTAGLHFTSSLMDKLSKQGHPFHYVTLHVGLGTFAPVKTQDLSDHTMHTEEYSVNRLEWDSIKTSKKKIAIGTTTLRVLESIWDSEKQHEANCEIKGETNIFLYPGKEVVSIDGLLTNFHLPQSTLLMLVSSLIGREKTLELYKEAVQRKYRFFSYGDAMLILRKERC